ncbi:hypothetical protein LTR85_007064 [Meristemomyces frigidus]|nr:hypothetical protein LTR85_007064 [Meristemomyces frigidus]
MQKFHQFAGVQDASDLQASSNERPSQPQAIPEALPEVDTHGQRAARASLPLNRQPSHKSFRSAKSRSQSGNRDSDGALDADYPPPPPLDRWQINDAYQKPSQRRTSRDTNTSGNTATENRGAATATAPEEDAVTEDFPWNGSHPCFPHPNPHCLPNSAEYQTTRVIRVRRDWLASGDLYPQYANLYPEILDPLVSDDDFRFLISNINARLRAAFDPFSTRAWVDAAMGVVTGFLWDDFGLTGAKRAEKGLERFLERWNKGREEEGREVRVVQPRRTGFMSLDFVVPDPGIDGMGDEEDEEEDEREREGEGGLGPAE